MSEQTLKSKRDTLIPEAILFDTRLLSVQCSIIHTAICRLGGEKTELK